MHDQKGNSLEGSSNQRSKKRMVMIIIYKSTAASSWNSNEILSPLCVRRILSASTALTSMISNFRSDCAALSVFEIVLVTFSGR